MHDRISRRDCLRSIAATAATCLFGSAAKTDAAEESVPKERGGYIDAHVHVWTPDTDDYPLAPGYKKEDMKPASFTPEELFAHMRPAGVDRVNLIQMSFYGFDNSYMLDAIDQHPGTFVGTAIVDPFGADPAEEMVQLSKRKCHAFRIHPGITQQPPESWLRPKPMEVMFSRSAECNLVLSALIGPEALPELDRMCARYPEAPVLIDHLCRIGAGSPIDSKDIEALAAMAKHKNVYVKIGAFYALGERKPPYLDLLPFIRRVVHAFTPDRCMWETDCPYQVVNHSYEDSIALIRDHADFLSTSDKQAILRDTAQRLLFRT
jgi:predicted TIM-barrel fold metal-dependent hydrolase